MSVDNRESFFLAKAAHRATRDLRPELIEHVFGSDVCGIDRMITLTPKEHRDGARRLREQIIVAKCGDPSRLTVIAAVILRQDAETRRWRGPRHDHP